jgi:hypothetical protein
MILELRRCTRVVPMARSLLDGTFLKDNGAQRTRIGVTGRCQVVMPYYP